MAITSFLFFSYMELVKAMGPGRRVLALDDSVLTTGATFDFQSVQQVAAECVLVLREALQGPSPVQLLLGGWSYGGVVAVEVAQQLAALGEASPFRVMLLTLFDAPLRQPSVAESPTLEDDWVVGSEVDSNSDTSNNHNSGLVALLSPTESSVTSQDLPNLTTRIEQHFECCTSLLRVYQQRMPQPGSISCPLLDVRPLQTTYDCGIGAAEEVVSLKENVWRHCVTGNHWTMLFGENVSTVGRVLLDSINRIIDISH
jgi:thioesterase domain-containing protein